MSFYPQKKEENNRFVTSVDQELLEDSNQNEKLPEFDEIGTALNDIYSH
ncbi:hypothetical protein QNH20_15500 [Neobacillus sp. WH10]|nr:hypothetical protein [Neobacillus sp. WH10]WHY75535.1 hypothetical protein QNH20_15500 [Neobacillus sp. WH10]